MTVRSVFLGLVGAALVCGTSFLNDRVLRQTYLVGNNMPVSVYGALILFVLIVNPLLRKWHLTARELTVVLALTLASCCLPGSGLLRTFSSSLVLPYHYEKLEPAWREEQILSYVPKPMMADISQDEDTVLGGFVQGLGSPGNHISPLAVPWRAWLQPVGFWIPLVLTLWFAMIALSVMVHRQWSRHEHLPYPIATFANSLLPENGDGRAPLFRERLFWIGTLAVLFIHTNNYLCAWFPEQLIPIPVRFSFAPLGQFFPSITRGGGWGLFTPTLYFSIGICFLIPTDLSFTFGIGPWLWALVVGMFAAYGLNLNNVVEGSFWYTGLKPRMFILFGANVGLFLALLYTGRHFYGRVLARACGLARAAEADGPSVWGCRAFLVSMAAFTALIVAAGVDWQLAVMYSAVLVVFYVVMTRIISKAGLFHVQATSSPVASFRRHGRPAWVPACCYCCKSSA